MYLGRPELSTIERKVQYLDQVVRAGSAVPATVRSFAALRLGRLYAERMEDARAGEMVDYALQLNPLNLEALREGRILLTEDKDFGQLVFAAGTKSLGVVLIRFPMSARSVLAPRILELVRKCPDRLTGSFAVLQPRRTRISELPRIAIE
jgi:predicted nuclease of predicted toxin-antitoxin system